MNKVYLSKEGKVYLNDHEITDVASISVKAEWSGSNVVLEFSGDYKSDFRFDVRTHMLDEPSDKDLHVEELDGASKETYEFQEHEIKLFKLLWLSAGISVLAFIMAIIALLQKIGLI